MKIKDILQHGSISFEFFPPKSNEGEDQLFETVRRLELLHPSFVSVTYGAGGGTLKSTARVIKRIKEKTLLTPMPHLTCIGQSRAELRSILGDYLAMGIDNVLALRGDLPKETTASVPKDGMYHARDLVEFAAAFNALSIGVAVYPEGHIEAPNLETDLLYAKQKIDEGADFAITQMFFDNRFFYDFMERADKIGIRVPVIPGIMPITDLEKIKRFSQMCGAALPAHLISRMDKATSAGEARKVGIEFATRQCEDLRRNGIRYLHFYTLNRAEAVTEILANLGLTPLEKDRMLAPARG